MAMVEETKPTGSSESSGTGSGFLGGVFRGYKPEQGRYARQTVFWTLLFLGAYGAYRVSLSLESFSPRLRETLKEVPVIGAITWAGLISVAAFGIYWLWMAWFLNRPKSADLLIETEEELKKVTWPTFSEAVNSSMVVIATVVLLASFVMLADLVLGKVISVLLFGGSK